MVLFVAGGVKASRALALKWRADAGERIVPTQIGEHAGPAIALFAIAGIAFIAGFRRHPLVGITGAKVVGLLALLAMPAAHFV
ncbi:MAG: hypothetical protein SFU86_18615 [Pirellulaceae bacterium]|nr:hypothetical protein [Pirellulaceae bacterium]